MADSGNLGESLQLTGRQTGSRVWEQFLCIPVRFPILQGPSAGKRMFLLRPLFPVDERSGQTPGLIARLCRPVSGRSTSTSSISVAFGAKGNCGVPSRTSTRLPNQSERVQCAEVLGLHCHRSARNLPEL
jgi:hypothetical protein